MHKTRLVKIQLIVFAILATLSLVYTGIKYSGIPRATGIGTYTATAHFVDGAGIYNNALVTYHGADIGRVKSVDLIEDGVAVTMQLDSDQSVPANTTASIKSVSAIGEQFVDLEPNSADGPFLHEGSVIPIERTSIPTSAGALVDNLNSLLASVPPGALEDTLNESSDALAGAGPAFGSLIDSADPIIALAHENIRQTTDLINDGETVLDAGTESSTDLTNAAQSLASFTERLAQSDGDIRSVVEQGPGFADTVGAALGDLTVTLPTLLANLQTVGQVLRVNVPGLQQILVVYPAVTASFNFSVQNQGLQQGGDPFAAQAPLDVKLLDTFAPVTCTEGYRGTQRRDPSDVSPMAANPDARCTLPQNDPRAVRGSRNIPCISNPAVRTALLRDCPGGAPSTWQGMLSAPVTGLPAPITAPPVLESQVGEPAPTAEVTPPVGETTPASSDRVSPNFVPYDPATGMFIAPDGKTYTISSLATVSTHKEAQKWEDLLTAPLST